MLLRSKKMYYNNYFANSKHNIKETWRGIKQLITLKQSNYSFPTVIEVGGFKLTTSKAIANTFDDYFSSIGSDTAGAIPTVNTPFETFLNRQICNSFVIFPTSISEIENIISNLNPSKSIGPFSIPTKLPKILKTFVSGPLACLINCSFSSGVVPDNLKITRVILVYKKVIKSTVAYYRPISLISIFNKFLEKLMYNRLLNFLEKHQVLFSGQFGFSASHSTSHAILFITDKIQKAIENKHYSCGIFLDLSKAFDTVNHNILLKKLENYGIRGVANEWFSFNLQNRRQYVTIANTNSEQRMITCGVPQGSVLGPLLFLLYINA